MQVTTGFLSQLVSPIIQKSNQIIEEKSKQIDEGENQTLKKAKVITKATGEALSEAFSGLILGAKQVGSALSTNTRQIVEKKYGDDVSNTFLGKNNDFPE